MIGKIENPERKNQVNTCSGNDNDNIFINLTLL